MHGHLHRGTPLTCKDLRGLCGEERSAECKNRCAIGRYSATTHPIQNAYTSCAEIADADEILTGIGAVMHHPSPFANTRSHPIDARISGTVVDAHDRPVANAIVYAEEQIAPFGDAYRIQATTDRSGHFDFGARLKHGVFEVYARKARDGYPDPNSAFYRSSDFSPETVQLFGERPEPKVTLKLGDKAGLLTGKITDADTGRPLEAGVVLVNLQTDAGRNQVVNGKFRELLPANTVVDVLVECVCQDHENWSRFETKVDLQPGEEKNLDIRLYYNASPISAG